MSILRSAFVMAVVGTSFVLPAARADDLAGTVAAKLRESGALAGYRVNVKAKSGTVWLEGRVADQKQLAAAVSLAENTPGVERVVNRLAIGKQADPTSGATFGMPASAWGIVGAPKGSTAKTAQPGVAAQTPAEASKAARSNGSPKTHRVRWPCRRHGPCSPSRPCKEAIPGLPCGGLCSGQPCGKR
jgi:hypothetical protein